MRLNHRRTLTRILATISCMVPKLPLARVLTRSRAVMKSPNCKRRTARQQSVVSFNHKGRGVTCAGRLHASPPRSSSVRASRPPPRTPGHSPWGAWASPAACGPACQVTHACLGTAARGRPNLRLLARYNSSSPCRTWRRCGRPCWPRPSCLRTNCTARTSHAGAGTRPGPALRAPGAVGRCYAPLICRLRKQHRERPKGFAGAPRGDPWQVPAGAAPGSTHAPRRGHERLAYLRRLRQRHGVRFGVGAGRGRAVRNCGG